MRRLSLSLHRPCSNRSLWRTSTSCDFRLVYRVPGYQQSIYKRAFVNLPFANGDDSWELPIPATFIADRDGSVLYASANPDYTDRPEPAEILQALTSFSHPAGQNPPVR